MHATKIVVEVINQLNTSIISNVIEAVTNCLLIKNSQGLDRFTAEFNHTFKEELTSMFFKLFYNI
jgi:hypothetical protein